MFAVVINNQEPQVTSLHKTAKAAQSQLEKNEAEHQVVVDLSKVSGPMAGKWEVGVWISYEQIADGRVDK